MGGRFLAGTVAVITGGGRGIGRAAALEMARAGAKVVVNDPGSALDGTGLETQIADSVVNEILMAGGSAIASYGSVATMESAREIVQTAIDAFGRVDTLLQCASNMRNKSVSDLSEDDFDAVIEVHLKGHFACIKAVLPHMIAQQRGRIINMSSSVVMGTSKGAVNYQAAKAGILGLTRGLALELEEHGITVNVVMPAAKTRRSEWARQHAGVLVANTDSDLDQDPASLAPVLSYLASDDAAHVTGRTFRLHRQGVVQLVSNPTPLGNILCDGDHWTHEELVSKVSELIV